MALTFALAQTWTGAWTPSWATSWLAALPSAPSSLSEAQIRAMVFVTLISGNAALILSNHAGGGQFWRSWRTPNATAYLLIGLAGVLLAVAIQWPWLSGPLKFEPPPLWPLLIALASGLLSGIGITVLHWAMAAWKPPP